MKKVVNIVLAALAIVLLVTCLILSIVGFCRCNKVNDPADNVGGNNNDTPADNVGGNENDIPAETVEKTIVDIAQFDDGRYLIVYEDKTSDVLDTINTEWERVDFTKNQIVLHADGSYKIIPCK